MKAVAGGADMRETRMPTTLPSPVDREEFQFVAVDASGAVWRWVDEDMVWVRGQVECGGEPEDGDAPAVLH